MENAKRQRTGKDISELARNRRVWALSLRQQGFGYVEIGNFLNVSRSRALQLVQSGMRQWVRDIRLKDLAYAHLITTTGHLFYSLPHLVPHMKAIEALLEDMNERAKNKQ